MALREIVENAETQISPLNKYVQEANDSPNSFSSPEKCMLDAMKQ